MGNATVISMGEQIVRIVSYHSARPHPPRVICETPHRLPPHPVHTVSDTLRQSRCSRNTALSPNRRRSVPQQLPHRDEELAQWFPEATPNSSYWRWCSALQRVE